MFDIFGQYFANPLSWVFMGLFIVVGVLLGIFLKPWFGNQVLKFIPQDHRFEELDIEEETAISVTCKKKKGMPRNRFFKLHPGFTGIVGRILKKPVTKYLGLEGTAYTWKIETGAQKLLGTLAEAVKSVWGEEFYEEVPTSKKELLEKSEIAVTVGLAEDPLTPTGMRRISEEDIKEEQDRVASETFWLGRKLTQRGFYLNLLFAGGTGFAICAVLVLLGVFKSPGQTTVIKETANQTAEIIRGLLIG